MDLSQGFALRPPAVAMRVVALLQQCSILVVNHTLVESAGFPKSSIPVAMIVLVFWFRLKWFVRVYFCLNGKLYPVSVV